MFNDTFTFGTAAEPTQSIESPPLSPCTSRNFRASSPCTLVAMHPDSQLSVTDLAACFAGSTIRTDAQICFDSCEAYAAADDDAGWQLDPVDDQLDRYLARTRSFPVRAYSPTRRRQRQSHTRLLCSTSHLKDIASLVSRMVACEDQCSVSLPLDPMGSPASEDDEGYNSCDPSSSGTSRRTSEASSRSQEHHQQMHQQQKARLQYRRSSDFSKTAGACVSKSVRVRKDRAHRRMRTSEGTSA